MSVLQFQLSVVPSVLAIDTVNKKVALNKRHNSTTFVDSINDFPTAIWSDKGLTFDSKEYPYNTWFDFTDNDPLRDYFHTIIKQCEAQQSFKFNF